MLHKLIFALLALLLAWAPVNAAEQKAGAPAGRAAIPERKKSPYLGAIVVDAFSGRVLAEESADEPGYPASVLKIMDLMVILDRVQAGSVKLGDSVQITRDVAGIGGSQVWLDPREKFSVEDLLYALMVQSANDAAVALAIHVGGSKEGFVALMNEKARALGMKNTEFHSVHGLPPSAGQQVDRTTARDLATLGRALVLQHPEALKYTATKEKSFREGPKPTVLYTHNHLLTSYAGCDGLKTGYIKAGGYSIVATAARNNQRVVCAILGSEGMLGRERDAKAAELMNKAFGALSSK